MGRKGERFSGKTIKNTWTKPRRMESGEGGGDGLSGDGGGRMHNYLNNNKIILKKLYGTIKDPEQQQRP